MIKQWKLEKASTERVGIIRSYNLRYITQGRCLEESVFFSLSVTLSVELNLPQYELNRPEE